MTTDPPQRPDPGRKRFPSRRQRFRAELMREWLGTELPTDVNQGVWCPAQFVDSILRKLGMADGLELDAVRTAWSELAGPFIAGHTEPVSVRNGCLVLKVSQPVMRFQLEQMKPMLLRQLQQALGVKKIRSVSFQIG